MRGHEIRHDILFLAHVPVDLHVFCNKAVIQRRGGLPHQAEHLIRYMFRSHLKLAGNMVFDKRSQERIALVVHYIIIPDARAHKHALHARHGGKFFQQRDIIPVIDLQVFAVIKPQALPVRTYAAFQLFFAGGRKFAVGPPTS